MIGFSSSMLNHTSTILIIHTYKAHLTNEQIVDIPKYLFSQHAAAVSESNSDVCYFIIPVSDAQSFFSLAAKNNITYKRVNLCELRQKYKNKRNYSVLGNVKLVSFLFSGRSSG